MKKFKKFEDLMDHTFAQSFEGKLLAYITFYIFNNTYFWDKYFYTVKDGAAYLLGGQDKQQTRSEDTLRQIASNCVEVGDYSQEDHKAGKYQPTTAKLTYSELIEKLDL